MFRSTVLLIGLFVAGGAGAASAQETKAGPGTVEVTVIPGGATFFPGRGNESTFRNYNLGGALTYNINRIVGVEGEVSGSVGISQNLTDGNFRGSQTPPNTLAYSGNLVVSLPTHSSVVPYVTGGVGGFTLFQQVDLGINGAETFVSGNVGGGVKWYAPNGRWGVRADYRFQATQSRTLPPFFSQEIHSHRIYGAVVINVVR